MRFAIDIGGTFTDLVVQDENGQLWVTKSPTIPKDPVQGVLDVLEIAARDIDISLGELLGKGEFLTHGTTQALNAILTGNTARTALLTTKGHPDILLIREGGREKFNYVQPYPDPYVPRSLTFEITERIGSQGEIVTALDEADTVKILQKMPDLGVEAVAVCFLWSIVNPVHENRVGQLISENIPDIPYTLSHRLNPCMREYRRASSTSIDASLKPIIAEYLFGLRDRLNNAGFSGRLLLITSGGGVMDLEDVARSPIHLINSGPAMAPVAGRHFGHIDLGVDTIIVADTGGTSYDVSLVRKGTIPWTRESWIGPEWTGHMTGFPSVDVKSIGTGGGSIAWIDDGGLLHVGPQSAGAVPGPVCYGRGGQKPTVTDACLALGYIDQDYFLGGSMPLDMSAAKQAIDEYVAKRMQLDTKDAALAIMQVVNENMVQLIEEISLNQGIDPREAVLVGGGGAAGLNAVSIARRLGCSKVIIPQTGAVLSAAGALLSDMMSDFSQTHPTRCDSFDFEGVDKVLKQLEARCKQFILNSGFTMEKSTIDFSAEMRYASEVWEIEVPIRSVPITSSTEVNQVVDDFHKKHEELFNTIDPHAEVHILTWRAKATCKLREDEKLNLASSTKATAVKQDGSFRQAFFPGLGEVDTLVRFFKNLEIGEIVSGAAIIESPFTTIVIDPGASVERVESGSLVIYPYEKVE
ncbi:MAG: hydantoinase/oxoprolinase family protein [Spirochaetota bacterium]|nr:MAG: hydantoinase/oxoprolinase family protein [Spirochaetota bacterium]